MAFSKPRHPGRSPYALAPRQSLRPYQRHPAALAHRGPRAVRDRGRPTLQWGLGNMAIAACRKLAVKWLDTAALRKYLVSQPDEAGGIQSRAPAQSLPHSLCRRYDSVRKDVKVAPQPSGLVLPDTTRRGTKLSSNLTKRQHFVPQTYLQGWAKDRWDKAKGSAKTVRAHFKEKNKSEDRNPESILVDKWFYEEDPKAPNNEIEKILGKYETSWSPTMAFLDSTLESAIKIYTEDPAYKESGESLSQYLMRTLVSMFSALPAPADTIKVFAALSYFRTPASLEKKISELENDPIVKESLPSIDMNAWWLAKNAFASTLIDRFKSLNVKFLVASEGSFVTSDRPCFDVNLADARFDPLLGYDIARLKSVVACFPLSSRLVALLVPEEVIINGKATQSPKYDAVCLTKNGVRLLNVGILRTAKKVVISTAEYQELADIDPDWTNSQQ
jgi:hypothetical protein